MLIGVKERPIIRRELHVFNRDAADSEVGRMTINDESHRNHSYHEGVVRTEAADSCVRPAFHKNLPSTAASNEIPRWQSAVYSYVFVDSPSLLFESGRFGYVPPNISIGPTCLAVTSPKVTYYLHLCSGKAVTFTNPE